MKKNFRFYLKKYNLTFFVKNNFEIFLNSFLKANKLLLKIFYRQLIKNISKIITTNLRNILYIKKGFIS